MTNPNRTHITLICDRTGSMHTIQSDAEGAVREFIKTQKAEPGECSLLLVDFDTQTPFNVVHDGPIADAPVYCLQPRGGTPLHDAIGLGIVRTGERLAALDEGDRPGTVIFVVQTDGQENASVEYTAERVKGLINEHTDKWNWTFVFLATGPDAWAASQLYQGSQLAANTVANTGKGHSHSTSTMYLSDQVLNTRRGVAASYAADVDDSGTVTERV